MHLRAFGKRPSSPQKHDGIAGMVQLCRGLEIAQVFREPMITTAGLSYEQSALQEHFAKLGMFDPVTRKPISQPEHAIPNLGLRAATEHYLQEHPWAWADVC